MSTAAADYLYANEKLENFKANGAAGPFSN
ncbi:MAG: hypothetical protein ACJAT1_000182 [Marivirga sp.]|jgi:hypothetical protein